MWTCKKCRRILHYFPRVLSILITLFFALFILEGFDPLMGWQSGVMHGLLAALVLMITITAWKKPKWGGTLFILFGLFWLFQLRITFNALLIAGLPIVTGILFIIDRNKIKTK